MSTPSYRLCYLYSPGASSPVDDFGDGTTVDKHYSQRMCFPMIPYGPPKMVNFRTSLGLPQDFDWNNLEYTEACYADAVKTAIGVLGEPIDFFLLSSPYGILLRAAEGVDAIRNLAEGSNPLLTATERGAAIVCGTAQLGGLFFTGITVTVLLMGLLLAPIGIVFAPCLWRCCCYGARNKRATFDAEVRESLTKIQTALEEGV